MPLENISQERDEKISGDVQDSDEEMDNCDEESEEDEGSLYAPTELTSMSVERSSAEGENLTSAQPPDSCRFLKDLPRELRDKVRAFVQLSDCALTVCLCVQIYGYVLTLDAPMSEHKLKLKCASCPNLTDTASKSIWELHLNETRNLLRTCHQIRNEGKRVFYDVNSWSLRRARLKQSQGHSYDTILNDSQRMFDRLGKIQAMKHFKHIDMEVSISPLAYCDLTVPDSLALDDPIAIHLFELSQDPGFLAFHKIDEPKQCALFRATCVKLVANQAIVFPSLRSITLKVSLHGTRSILFTPRDPLDRCGITFYIRIKLEPENHLSPTSPENTSLPVLAPKGARSSTSPSQHAKLALHSRDIQPSINSDSWFPSPLDARICMLYPLGELLGVESVEVERRWTVRYRQTPVKDEIGDIHVQPLRQLWRFRSVCEMLEKAGPGFGKFLNPGLQYLKTSPKDVLEINENTNEGIDYQLVM